jgi:3-oxoacyl-[acyl-carrier protein] reductase
MTRFQGKTVLVTGGAKGIGAATAKRFASEGATVVVADFDEAAAQETAQAIGGHAVRCDVTKREDVEEAVEAAVSHGGSLDVLVTCAGIIRDNMLFKMTDDDWDAVIDTHLQGTFFAVRAAQKHMVGQKSGKMVLISSTSALGNRGQVNYSTAKAGLQGMTKTLAIELGPFNVNVNCDDAADRRPHGRPVRAVHGGRLRAGAAEARRPARGRRRHDRLPLLGRRELRERPGDLRRGRPAGLVQTFAVHVEAGVVVLHAG